MSLTDYQFNPNSFDAVRVAILLVATFASEGARKRELTRWCAEYLLPYQQISKDWKLLTKDKLKDLKKSGLSEVSNLILHNSGKYAPLLSLEPDPVRAINIAMTLARWPEWFIYPESYLQEVAENLWDHRNEINAITYYEDQPDGSRKRICPYDPAGFVDDMDLEATMRHQSVAIEEFCNREQINSTISVDMVIDELHNIKRECVYSMTHDSFEQGFFDSIQYIRNNIWKVIHEMRLYKAGKATDRMFGRSESRSVLSDDPAIMHILKLCGWTKKSCPNVLSNIFAVRTQAVDLKQQAGQIVIDKMFDYFTTAPGLGPALKLRYVYNLIMQYQNYLAPLADLIKESDKQYDSIQESYVNQMQGLQGELAEIVDAYCVDATGYSDYMFRGTYKYIFELYNLPADLIEDIMSIFRLPVKVGEHICKVVFGGMQGCKLLVFVMNHANRLIGIIARRLSNQKIDFRHNAGDDTISLSRAGTINKDTIHNEMKVFSIFNCVINPMKTAHLAEQGYCDFCSKYFMRIPGADRGIVSITGIPPKLIGKDMPSIKSFTEIFRVLDLCGSPRNLIKDVWNICKPLLSSELESGCRLPNSLDRRYTLEEKEKLAQDVSYKLGGLAEEGEVSVEQIASHALIILEKMVIRYRFQITGVFRVVQGIIDPNTELYRALGTVEHLGLSKILDAISKLRAGLDTGAMDQKDLNECCQLITQLDRCIIKGISISATSSTYHRLTATRDIDSLLEPDARPDFSMLDKLAKPTDMLEMALMAAISAETYTDVDQIRRYMQARDIIHRNPERFVTEVHGKFTNYYAVDDDNLRIKLTTVDRKLGPNNSGNYKMIDDMINKELQYVCRLLAGDRMVLKALIELQSDMGATALMDYLHVVVGDIADSMKGRILKAARDYEKELLLKRIKQQHEDYIKELGSL